MLTVAILTAAGSGSRLGLDIPKALALLRGTPLVVHAAKRLAASGAIDHLVITASDGFTDRIGALMAAERSLPPVTVVAGGATRQASVAAGLAAADPGFGIVLVHDAARALVPPALVRRVAGAVRSGGGGHGGYGAVIPVLPVTDTIKVVAPVIGGLDLVVQTVDRSMLRSVQTPQGFAREVLERAHREAAAHADHESTAATDDAGLVEALGEPVHAVEGDARALKITTSHDLRVAELMLTEELMLMEERAAVTDQTAAERRPVEQGLVEEA